MSFAHMVRAKSLSYILTLRLDTTIRDEAILDKRFEICRKLYNAILKDSYKVAEKIQKYIKENLDLVEAELGYITIHIDRIWRMAKQEGA